MRAAIIPAIICTIIVALVACILAFWPSNRSLHATVWVRPHALESESILLFDSGTFEANFSFDIGPGSKSVGTWHKRQDLKTEEVITLEPSTSTTSFVNAYGHLFIRTLANGEHVLVPGSDVAAFDAGDKYNESMAFHRSKATNGAR